MVKIPKQSNGLYYCTGNITDYEIVEEILELIKEVQFSNQITDFRYVKKLKTQNVHIRIEKDIRNFIHIVITHKKYKIVYDQILNKNHSYLPSNDVLLKISVVEILKEAMNFKPFYMLGSPML